MFRTVPVAESAPVEVVPATEVVPLSVLALDLGEPSTGWASHLADRGIGIVLDDLGRASVARSDARQLFDERRQDEIRRHEAAVAAEQQAIEADRVRRASIWRGIPADHLPPGVAPAAAMFAADQAAQPKRLTPLQEALSNSGELTYHPLPSSADES